MPLKVSQADFRRFFSIFGASFKCEICSNERFTIVSDPEQETVGFVAHKEGKGLQAIELVAVFCDKCGNTKSFLGQHVADWVEANPE